MVFSLIANPFFAKNMSPTDYATVGYYTAFNSLITPLVNFYLIHYYTKRFFELKKQELINFKATIFKLLIYFSIVLSILALLGLYIYCSILNKNSNIPFFPYALISVLSIPISGIYTLTLVDYKMQRDSKRFFKLSVFTGILALLIGLFLVVFLKYGALGKLSSILISNIIIFIYCLFINKNLFKEKFDKSIFKKSIIFCFPLVIASMLTFFSSGYDKVFLERVGNIVELGYYVVGVSIAGYINVFSNSINNTFQPDIYESVVKRNFIRCAKFIGLKLIIVFVIVFVFILLAPYIINILTAGRYIASTKYAIIISFSTITSMMYYSVSQVTVAMGYTKITLINKIIGSLFSLLIFSFFIKKWGAIGASWGVVLSFGILFIGNVLLLLIYDRRKIRIKIHNLKK